MRTAPSILSAIQPNVRFEASAVRLKGLEKMGIGGSAVGDAWYYPP